MLNERDKKQARPAQSGRAMRTACAQPQPVWFEYSRRPASEVTIVGSFNNWDVSDTRMVRLVGGRWVRVLFLPSGRYEYLFVVNGHCVADPRAAESVPNVFGCTNSVVIVPAFAPAKGCVHGRLTTARQIPRKLNQRRNCKANASGHRGFDNCLISQSTFPWPRELKNKK